MAEPARAAREYDLRRTVDEYFGLVHQGRLRPDDRVELLDGLIVAMSPHNPPHAEAIARVDRALQRAVADRGVVRAQLPLVLGNRSALEPDVSVVPQRAAGYADRHPRSALLVVEVADSSLAQDRLTKAAMYARSGVPEYWIVNLVEDRIEIFVDPVRRKARYQRVSSASRGQKLEITAFPGTKIAVDDLLPPPASGA